MWFMFEVLSLLLFSSYCVALHIININVFEFFWVFFVRKVLFGSGESLYVEKKKKKKGVPFQQFMGKSSECLRYSVCCRPIRGKCRI